MTTLEYLDRRREINAQISDLKLELCSVENQYIRENAEFKIGQKVKITNQHGERISVVTGHKIAFYDAGIEYILCKLKKDGKMSMIRDTVWHYEKITALPSDEEVLDIVAPTVLDK